MPLHTENLNLTKPAEDEFYNIAVPNGNMDIIDETIRGLREEVAALRAALAEKVDKSDMVLEWHPIPTLEHYRADTAKYAIDESGCVHLTGRIVTADNYAPVDPDVPLAVLPEGFRPKYICCTAGTILYTPGGRYTSIAVGVTIDGDGVITRRRPYEDTTVPYTMGGLYLDGISFVAATE